MTQRNLFRNAHAWMILLTGLLVASGSLADDRKVFNGLNCRNTTDSSQIKYTSRGGAINSSTSSSHFRCAVVRDNTLDSMNATDWDVTVQRNGSTGSWTIRLLSCDADGANDDCYKSSTLTVNSSQAAQTLDGASITNAYPNGQVLLMSDNVPPDAEIISYNVAESEG